MKTIISTLFLFISLSIIAQNVGIDVSNPIGKLHVKGNSSLGTPQLRLTEVGNDYARLKMESGQHPGAYWDIAAKADTLTEDALLNFFFRNDYNAGNRLTIRGNGNVGINNIDPLAKLDIKNIGDGVELLRFTTERPWIIKQTDNSVNSKLTLQSTVNDKVFNIVSSDSSTVTAAFKANNNFPGAYLVPTKGKVGIGTYTPNARMAVEGSPNEAENILRVNVNYDGNIDIAGLDCDSYPATGYGVGGNFRGGYRGLRGLSDAGTSQRTSIGVVGAAWGINNQGTRVGLWGNAYGGNINWAGYFDNGNVYIKDDLRIGSGAVDGATGYKVAVKGKIIAEEMRINLQADWPDYVFDKKYELMPIDELEKSIAQDHHLPGMPSAMQVAEGGLIVGEMQTMMMEKIEELTLYIIEINNELKEVNKELDILKSNKE